MSQEQKLSVSPTVARVFVSGEVTVQSVFLRPAIPLVQVFLVMRQGPQTDTSLEPCCSASSPLSICVTFFCSHPPPPTLPMALFFVHV